MKATIFENINVINKPYFIAVDQALERIKLGKSRNQVERIRSEVDDTKKANLKKELPSVCFSGTFSTRFDSQIIKHSGLICLDFDKIEDISLEVVKETLCADDYIFACWVSPSGNGLKALVKIPEDPENHKGYFEGLKNYFQLESFDEKCKNLSRVCYESYDPDIYINRTSKVFTKLVVREIYTYQEKQPEVRLDDEGKIFERLKKWMHNNGEHFEQGNMNNFLFKIASACNRFGIRRDAAEHFILQDFPPINRNEAIAAIKNGYKNANEYGTQYFEDRQTVKIAKEMIANGSHPEKVKDYLTSVERVDQEKAEKAIETAVNQFKTRIETFWKVQYNPGKGTKKIVFNYQGYKNWLQKNGFALYRPGEFGWVIVRIVDNIVSKITESKQNDYTKLKSFVMSYVDTLPDEFDFITKSELWEFMAKGHKAYYQDSLFELLDEPVIEFNQDTKDEAFFYFQNCAVKVTENGIDEIPYSELNGVVWETHIINRVYIPVEKPKSDYQTFIKNVSSGDDDRADKLEQIIGYLLHSYKNDSFAPVVILNDEAISEFPEGGTGKGIFVKGIREFKRAVVIDGKNWGFEKSFAWQRIDMDTQIIAFEDIKKKFDFEKLFSIITEGMPVEKKNKNEFFIPFDRMGKMIITTNYPVEARGNSNERRKIDVEFSQHYNGNHTPVNEFGRLFFKDWTANDYNQFDSYMLGCVVKYLKEGPIIEPPIPVNLNLKTFYSQTSRDFVDWSATELKAGVKYDKVEIRKEFLIAFPGQDKFVTPHRFTKWLKSFADYYGYELIEFRAATRQIMFSTGDENENIIENEDELFAAPF